ncbi:PhzF family phenazine biosynthesis protein [Pseudoxanthomonas composti]|uniref:PhzF family phenazine biosynthesis protein n=1 Tax=Pseudoxanthomonas composti TaxID=2137479 RepID=A0A4Q1JRJ7_9GAMM|nr:PhzF family phenazine biosynthesis protein [Pseudoxanthomonas composti]RXR00331.1 PhzF family phenazine biosynthesis protein [Pseudoxanthomonas composti]
MRLPISIVDAFTRTRFGGNPAAVVVLSHWLAPAQMQAIAAENNLSETAFVLREPDGAFAIRWFSPATEIAFCGHATLASAHVIAQRALAPFPIVVRAPAVGQMQIARSADGHGFEMDFPLRRAQPVEAPAALLAGLSIAPRQVLRNVQAWIAVYAQEREVREVMPDLERLKTLGPLDVAVTAPGDRHDFVSRYFWPANGGTEDPVTGSIHTALAPYWAERLGRSDLRALQASWRSGELRCRVAGERVHIAGDTVQYLDGHIEI